jgi:hypothetical protein
VGKNKTFFLVGRSKKVFFEDINELIDVKNSVIEISPRRGGRKTKVFINDQGDVIRRECVICGEVRDLKCFYKETSRVLGVTNKCKNCAKIQSAEKYGASLHRFSRQTPLKIKLHSTQPIKRDKNGFCKVKVGSYSGGKDISVEINEENHIVRKKCPSCRDYLGLHKFHVNHMTNTKTATFCIDCSALYREENKEYYKIYAKNYYQSNSDKFNLIGARRRARLLGLRDDFTPIQKRETLDFFDWGCSLTGDTLFHWDHVVPVSVGTAGTTYGNMIPLRPDLNLSKKNKNIFEWFNSTKNRLSISDEKFTILISWLAEVNKMSYTEYKSFVYKCHDKTGMGDNRQRRVGE